MKLWLPLVCLSLYLVISLADEPLDETEPEEYPSLRRSRFGRPRPGPRKRCKKITFTQYKKRVEEKLGLKKLGIELIKMTVDDFKKIRKRLLRQQRLGARRHLVIVSKPRNRKYQKRDKSMCQDIPTDAYSLMDYQGRYVFHMKAIVCSEEGAPDTPCHMPHLPDVNIGRCVAKEREVLLYIPNKENCTPPLISHRVRIGVACQCRYP